MLSLAALIFFFFFNDTATTEIYTLSLHDALPICFNRSAGQTVRLCLALFLLCSANQIGRAHVELQSPCNLVCRLLLEKKNNKIPRIRFAYLINNIYTMSPPT